MHRKDPDHWLYRFTAEEWLRAADGELRQAREALAGKHHKTGVAGARRAAGMAWNAALWVASDETGYGRSYMDHLKVLAQDPSAPPPVRQAAQDLVAAPLTTDVIPLGAGDTRLADAAEAIVQHARERVAPKASA